MNVPSISSSLVAARKPMAAAARVNLYEREVRERLSTSAIELLFSVADVLSEGGVAPENPLLAGKRAGAAAFFGSTMLTIDLARLGGAVRELCDETGAEKVAALIASDARIERRVRKIAERESTRIAARRLLTTVSELRVRTRGTMVFLDVDIEAALSSSPPLSLVRPAIGAR